MALPEETKLSGGKSPQKQNAQVQKSDKREKPLTKVVIRRLPPTIERETFLNQISPVPNYDYFYLVNGEAALGENSFSRAYVNFVNPNDVFDFKEKFDNYVFLDHKGNEYAAVVEFAAFQKIPKKRNKVRVDPKCGTIETDPIYIEFVENLNKPVEQEDKPEYSYQFSTETKDKDSVTTPLLEFVKNRRVERMRIREERREERRKRELERKKLREEERKKRFEEKSPTKVFSKLKIEDRETSDTEVKDEKRESNDNKSEKKLDKPGTFKSKERKFEDRKKEVKVKSSPRKEYPEKREFKGRKEYYKESKFDSYKKDEKQFPKKVKKYSEKREERKIEAQKAELKKVGEQEDKSVKPSTSTETKEEKVKEVEVTSLKSPIKTESLPEKSETTEKVVNRPKVEKESTANLEKSEINQDNQKNQEKLNKTSKKENGSFAPKESKSTDSKDSETKFSETKESRRERIRNKDRPTIAIYRPGMLSKRKLAEGDTDKDKESIKEASKETK